MTITIIIMDSKLPHYRTTDTLSTEASSGAIHPIMAKIRSRCKDIQIKWARKIIKGRIKIISRVTMLRILSNTIRVILEMAIRILHSRISRVSTITWIRCIISRMSTQEELRILWGNKIWGLMVLRMDRRGITIRISSIRIPIPTIKVIKIGIKPSRTRKTSRSVVMGARHRLDKGIMHIHLIKTKSQVNRVIISIMKVMHSNRIKIPKMSIFTITRFLWKVRIVSSPTLITLKMVTNLNTSRMVTLRCIILISSLLRPIVRRPIWRALLSKWIKWNQIFPRKIINNLISLKAMPIRTRTCKVWVSREIYPIRVISQVNTQISCTTICLIMLMKIGIQGCKVMIIRTRFRVTMGRMITRWMLALVAFPII